MTLAAAIAAAQDRGGGRRIVLQQPRHGVRRLRAILHPVLDAVVLQASRPVGFATGL